MADNIKKIVFEVVENCETMQIATLALDGFPETRMVRNLRNFKLNPQYKEKLEPTLDIYCLTNISTQKYEQLKKDSRACMYFFDASTRKAMTVFGRVEILQDIETKKFFWDDSWKRFGYENFEDKNLCLLKFKPERYKYYDREGKRNIGNI